jgi:hypothetical protein
MYFLYFSAILTTYNFFFYLSYSFWNNNKLRFPNLIKSKNSTSTVDPEGLPVKPVDLDEEDGESTYESESDKEDGESTYESESDKEDGESTYDPDKEDSDSTYDPDKENGDSTCESESNKEDSDSTYDPNKEDGDSTCESESDKEDSDSTYDPDKEDSDSTCEIESDKEDSEVDDKLFLQRTFYGRGAKDKTGLSGNDKVAVSYWGDTSVCTAGVDNNFIRHEHDGICEYINITHKDPVNKCECSDTNKELKLLIEKMSRILGKVKKFSNRY